jgi:hypothetical protein
VLIFNGDTIGMMHSREYHPLFHNGLGVWLCQSVE